MTSMPPKNEPQIRRWIVLIDRVPRGPLLKNEIDVLIKEGIIRRNDLAMQVEALDPQTESAWKFLWQYSEFDRRKGISESTPSQSQAAQTPDRRAKPNSTVDPFSADLLPDAILKITPEELVLRASPVPSTRDEEAPQPVVQQNNLSRTRESLLAYSSSSSLTWAISLGVVLVGVGFSYFFFNPKEERIPKTPATITSEEDPMRNTANLPTELPLSGKLQVKPSSPNNTPPSLPKAPPAEPIREPSAEDLGIVDAPDSHPEEFDDLEHQPGSPEEERSPASKKRSKAKPQRDGLPGGQGANPLRLQTPENSDSLDGDNQETPPWDEPGEN